MTARDIFLLIVRVTGFLLIVAAMTYIVSILTWRLLHLPPATAATPPQLIGASAVLLVSGLIVLAGANTMTQLIYGRE
jgi:hypothetical protein